MSSAQSRLCETPHNKYTDFSTNKLQKCRGGGQGEGEETRDTSTNCKGWSYLNLDSNTLKKLSKTIEEIQTLTGYLIVIKVLLLILKCENDIAVMFNERVLSF